MKPIPAARQAASVPPTVVAPTAPWTIAAARSRGPTLRASAVEAAELVLALGEADAEPAVEDADRRRHRARLAHAPLALEPDLDALAGREAVRDERRLERDDGAPVGERVADLVRDGEQELLHGIEPSCATQRAAAASASSGPPTR